MCGRDEPHYGQILVLPNHIFQKQFSLNVELFSYTFATEITKKGAVNGIEIFHLAWLYYGKEE